MKVLTVFTVSLLLVASPRAEEIDNWSLVVGGISKHAQPYDGNGNKYNEHNTMLGIEYREDSEWAFSGFTYKNSEHRWSHAAALQYTPYQYKQLYCGFAAALATGYSGTVFLTPIVGATVEWRMKRSDINVTFVPDIPGATGVILLTGKIRF